MKHIDQLRKRLGYFLVTCIALYLVVSVYLLLFPGATFINRKVTQYYEWFVLPGPFFREDRIRYVPRFSFRYKDKTGTWSEFRDIEKENFLKYHDGYFNYPHLKRSKYERFMARTLSKRIKAKKIDPAQSREFRELHAYLKANYLPPEIDSVELDYAWRYAQADTSVHQVYIKDFHIVYKPF